MLITKEYSVIENPVEGVSVSNNIEDYPSGLVIPVDKPYRWTSADVVRKTKFRLQRFFGIKNIKYYLLIYIYDLT